MGKDFGYQQESESPTKKRKIQANTDEMAAPEQFEGFMIHDTKNWTKFSKEKFTPKTFEDYDVDIENECCGVCGSDVHTMIETIDISEEGCSKAVQKVKDNDVRYRVTLTGFHK